MQIEIKPITVPGKMFGESPPSYNQPERLWRHILFKSLVQYHKNLFLNFFILSEVSFFFSQVQFYAIYKFTIAEVLDNFTALEELFLQEQPQRRTNKNGFVRAAHVRISSALFSILIGFCQLCIAFLEVKNRQTGDVTGYLMFNWQPHEDGWWHSRFYRHYLDPLQPLGELYFAYECFICVSKDRVCNFSDIYLRDLFRIPHV